MLEEIHDADLPATLAADRPGWKHVERLIKAGAIDVVLVASLLSITTDWDEVPAVMAIRRQYGVEFQTPTHPHDGNASRAQSVPRGLAGPTKADQAPKASTRPPNSPNTEPNADSNAAPDEQ